jgi:hypothetical protein
MPVARFRLSNKSIVPPKMEDERPIGEIVAGYEEYVRQATLAYQEYVKEAEEQVREAVKAYWGQWKDKQTEDQE